MTSKVILKRSSVPARVPVSGDLEYGELALNYADEKLYFKNTSNVIKSFNISGGGEGGQSAFDFQTYTASAAQTTFAITYTAPYVNVYVNGVRQSDADYTATSGSSVILAVAANAGDIINLVGFNTSFSLTIAGYGDSLNPYASKTANTVLAAPNGSAGAPSFRALVAADIPTLNQNTTGTASNVTGTVAVANGGTGATSAAAALTNLGAYPATNPSGYTNNTGTVTGVTGTAPIVSSGGTAPAISISAATTSAAGSMSSADKTKLDGIASGATNVTNTNQLTNGAGYITSAGTATNVSGTVAIVNGGTGQTTRQAAMDALAGAVTSGQYLRGDGTDVVMSAIQAGDVPTLNQNTTGSAATLTTGRTIALTGDVTYTSGSFNGSANVTGTATLANSGATPGTYGDSTNIPQIAVDAKGRVTSVSNVAVSIPSGSLTFTGDVSGTGSTGSSTTLTLAAAGTAGTYTKVTTDSKGRVTSGTTLAAVDIPNLDASKITSGVIDAARLPSYVDDVVEAANLAGFPATGETGKIYVALDTNKTYRWSGSAYVFITSGAVDSVAGKTGVVTLVAGDVGLGNVENKSSATIRSEITSGNVTTALGFTPYNATNPSGYITSAGTAANVSGTVAVANGGTGATTAADARTNLGLAIGTDVLAPNGSAASLTSFPTFNQNTTGTAANVTGTVAIANGGTGQTTRQAAMDALAGAVTAGQYLRGDGTDVVMSTIQASDVPTLNQNTTGTAANVTGIVAVANGGTGTATPGLVAGTNITVTGSWPNQTIDASGGGGSSALTLSNKTSAYTVVAGDLGTIINCTSGSFTVSLTAAATLGAGFNVTVWNTGTGVITIDPSGTETIDTKTTLILRAGEGMQVVCNGTNWDTGAKKTMRGYAENIAVSSDRAEASGYGSAAINAQYQGRATTTGAFAISGTASGVGSVAIYGVSGSTYSATLGQNSGGNVATTATGTGAMALGGSYASGIDSFAAGVGNNTSSYGATGANSVSIGYNSKSTSNTSVGIGYLSNAGGSYSVGIGYGATTSAAYCVAISADYSSTASATGAVALGTNALSNIIGKYAYAGSYLYGAGSAQTGTFVLSIATTNATPAVLVTNLAAAGALNQLILPNNSAYAFTGIIVARQKASEGTASAAWQVTGLIRREGSAATTVLVDWAMTTINNTPGWTLALSADTTNGGLAVTATGAAATNIRWVATIQSSEVTYA